MAGAVPPRMQAAAVTRKKGQSQPSFPYVVSVRHVDGSIQRKYVKLLSKI